MAKFTNEFKESVSNTYEREGIFAAIMWAMVLPVFMVAAMVTDLIYGA